jgi:hypothetical protein
LKLRAADAVVADWLLSCTTQSKLPKHPFFVRAYLAFSLAWNILGKQFLVVARSPAA